MALIKCPECNKEVSDKAEVCIHCGYPLRNTPYIHEIINGKDIDLTFLKDDSISQIHKLTMIREKSGCDATTAMPILLKYSPTKPESQAEVNKIKCPHCGSTSITTGARGVNQFWGLLGASQTVNRCANCGHTWKPTGK